jgi:hypothetical protein
MCHHKIKSGFLGGNGYLCNGNLSYTAFVVNNQFPQALFFTLAFSQGL